MLKLKLTKTLVLGVCLTLASSGAVYASEDKSAELTAGSELAVVSTMIAPDAPVSSPANPGQAIDEDVLKLQREIDRFVFDQHRGEFAEKGFSVTHTGPMVDYVEIGIEPYSEESAEYLYSMFGKEKVKVIEGQLAVTLAAATGAEPAIDTPLSAPVAEGAPEVVANVVSDAVDTTAEVSITSSESGEKNSNALLYGLGVMVVLGAGAFGVKRMLPQGKK